MRRKPLFVLYLFVTVSILLEIGVRLSGYSEHHLYDPIYKPFALTPDIPYVHKPNLVNARARGLAVINEAGLVRKNDEVNYDDRIMAFRIRAAALDRPGCDGKRQGPLRRQRHTERATGWPVCGG